MYENHADTRQTPDPGPWDMLRQFLAGIAPGFGFSALIDRMER
ncbi:hypothetical protein [Falsirhodobacter sp. alg1]|nr:hypothetical protein [Falsirhodobacter sp. alg1]